MLSVVQGHEGEIGGVDLVLKVGLVGETGVNGDIEEFEENEGFLSFRKVHFLIL